jgi:DNA-binding MurR/RpiR family transcriptional regulator
LACGTRQSHRSEPRRHVLSRPSPRENPTQKIIDDSIENQKNTANGESLPLFEGAIDLIVNANYGFRAGGKLSS